MVSREVQSTISVSERFIMQINVKGKHLEITEAIDAYVRTKSEKFKCYTTK